MSSTRKKKKKCQVPCMHKKHGPPNLLMQLEMSSIMYAQKTWATKHAYANREDEIENEATERDLQEVRE